MSEATRPGQIFRHASPTLALCLLLVCASPLFALDPDTRTTLVEGTIVDERGEPLADCRVVSRIVGGSAVYVSLPSDAAGRYAIRVPTGRSYVLVALISPAGARVPLPGGEPLLAEENRVARDVSVELPAPLRARGGARAGGPMDRLFFSFAEDPALAAWRHLELRVERTADDTTPDLTAVRGIAAFTFPAIPRVEIGARVGHGDLRVAAANESGALDSQLWAKLHFARGGAGRWDAAAGALLILPTGDEDAGLGNGAIQAEWFVAASRTLAAAVVIGHVGIASSEDGEAVGAPLDGKLALSSGLGLVLPLSDDVSVVFEAVHDGARFEETEADSRVLAGVSWRAHWRGRLRAAVAAGLADAAPDVELTAGYALAF